MDDEATAALPSDWQARIVDMIRGAAPLDGHWFTGGPVCTGEEQIEIYRSQYAMRLYDALLVEIPGLKAILGDGGELLLRRYLDETPSRTWTLNRVADQLADWMATQPDATPAALDMARLDQAIQIGFEAADGEPIDLAVLATMPNLRLQPHVRLLRLRHNVHEIRAAALTGAEIPELRTGDFPIVVFRRGIGMRHWQVPLGLWGILDGLRRGRTVQQAIDDVFEASWATVDELGERIGDWFRDLAERNLVSVKA